MKVLVTGGAGYIGSAVVSALANDATISKVIIYDNLSNENHNIFLSAFNKFDNNKVEFEFGDILDSRKLGKTLAKVDAVIHLAAKVAPAYADVDSHSYEQVNHWGTAELVYAIEQSKIKNFVHVSSTAVYGSSTEPINESVAPAPVNFYGVAKLRGEEHVRRLGDKIQTHILRCGNVYGFAPAINFESVINKFMFDAQYKNRISIHGNGYQSRGFININKVVSSIIACLKSNVPAGTYNLADINLPILDIVDVLKEIYPSLEFIFMNQHLTMRDLQIDTNLAIKSHVAWSEVDFKTELEAFKANFSFNAFEA